MKKRKGSGEFSARAAEAEEAARVFFSQISKEVIVDSMATVEKIKKDAKDAFRMVDYLKMLDIYKRCTKCGCGWIHSDLLGVKAPIYHCWSCKKTLGCNDRECYLHFQAERCPCHNKFVCHGCIQRCYVCNNTPLILCGTGHDNCCKTCDAVVCSNHSSTCDTCHVTHCRNCMCDCTKDFLAGDLLEQLF